MEPTIYGLAVRSPPPAGSIPLEAVAVVKCLDGEGEPFLQLVTTENLSSWEALGMLSAACRATEDELVANFIDDEDDDDEP